MILLHSIVLLIMIVVIGFILLAKLKELGLLEKD
jgi:hypothetical protein